MKKLISLAMMFLAAFSLKAQVLTISFQPQNSGTQIDSIWVTNQRTDQKVKLLGGESLALTKTTGSVSLQNFADNGTLYPNPGSGEATLEFSTADYQQVEIRICHITGQIVTTDRKNLPFGNHQFRLQFPANGIYMVYVMKKGGLTGFKAVCTGIKMQDCRVVYAGSESPEPLKKSMTGKTLGYTAGDILRYSVFSGKNNTIIMDSPAADKIYTVELYECRDKDNQNYPVVRIGNQWWMAANLKTTKYRDGSSIANVTGNALWAGLTSGAYCWFDNAESNKNTLGAYYNWYTVADSRGVCPDGWHMPTDAEWTDLENYLVANGYNYDGSTSGNKIAKSLASTAGWTALPTTGRPGNDLATNNASGFSALPGSYRNYDGSFSSPGNFGAWWSFTESSTAGAWYRSLGNDNPALGRANDSKLCGVSVRCVRDLPADPASLTFSLIGSSSSWTEDVDFTYNGRTGDVANYRIPSRKFTQNEEFKIRVNHKWDQNYGYNNIKISGESANFFSIGDFSNIGVRSERVYEVTFHVDWTATYPATLGMWNLSPSVTTTAATSVTSATAVSGGNVLDEGYSVTTSRGVCWNTAGSPITAGNKTTDGSGKGAFTSNLTGLTPNTTYYVRAYAINSQGTSYGDQVQFTTLGQTVTQPSVTTGLITDFTQTTATGGGNVTSDGGAAVTARGVCWSTLQNPTVANSKTTDGTGTGTFTSNLTGLTASTTYYVRAYATNSQGTAYGNEVSFTTQASVTLPTVTTANISSITQTTAIGGGNVIKDGGAAVTARGICWSSEQNPTTANNKTTDGSGTGVFTSSITGLSPEFLYYVRAYATNNAGTAYGEQKFFHSKYRTGTFQDTRDSRVYSWVEIAGQIWMAENLAYLPYVNPLLLESETTSFYYVLGYEGTDVSAAKASSYFSTYGTLYNWPASLTACPVGWHLPSDDEWTELENYMIVNLYNYDGTKTGNKLAKSLASSTGWNASVIPGTPGNDQTSNNSTGFSGKPGGYRYSYNAKYYIGESGIWWSSTASSTAKAWYRSLSYDFSNVLRGDISIVDGFSVRCVKDLFPTVRTASITNITLTSATSGGNVLSEGELPVTSRGVCWNTSGAPTIANSKTTDGSGAGAFSSNITGLTSGTQYYVRAYAMNGFGPAYGNEISFITQVVVPPTVTTSAISSITQTIASGGGSVTADGGAAVTARGVCWSTSQNPTTANSKTTDGSGIGTFTSSLTGLTAGTLYYVRAYATNSAGTAYGEQLLFHAKNQTGLFQDSRDQTFYHWVKIGTQTWMSDNLGYLPNVSPSSTGSDTSPYYYVYDYQGTDPIIARNLMGSKGALYNYPAALTACPAGWHLPTDAEWTTLENYMIANGYNYDGTTTGNKISKSLASTTGWNVSATTGAPGSDPASNNSSGFSALPGGRRYLDGNFNSFGYSGSWWSSTENTAKTAWHRSMLWDGADFFRNAEYRECGFSIRCLKD